MHLALYFTSFVSIGNAVQTFVGIGFIDFEHISVLFVGFLFLVIV